MNRIVVLGSMNLDIVTRVPRFPEPGETIAALHYAEIPGGKGANQAYAAALLGSEVVMLGKVAADAAGDRLISSLASVGVDTSHIERVEGQRASTGRAVITVNTEGENTILHVPGTNGMVDQAYIERHLDVIDDCDILLLQLEIPLAAVVYAAIYAHGLGKRVILDPAPARTDLPDELLDALYLIKPNETEIARLVAEADESKLDVELAAKAVQARGAANVIVTLGAEGAYLLSADGTSHKVCAKQVDVVDTTAAGDAFAGAIASILAGGGSLETAIDYASLVSALTITKEGAQGSMPTPDEVALYREIAF